MKIREWINENCDFGADEIVKTSSLITKVLFPYLEYLGYDKSNIKCDEYLTYNISGEPLKHYADITVKIDDRSEIIIYAKNPNNTINDKDILLAECYANLIESPAAIYSIVTNGVDCVVINTFNSKRESSIPSKSKLLRERDKARRHTLSNARRKELQSILQTILHPDKLYKAVKDCKESIEKKGLIRTDQSFKEMTKILLIKMNEERRISSGELNRFTVEYFNSQDSALSAITKLFNDAKKKYPSIYSDKREELYIEDNDCITEIITKLEPYSFIGTGDDIKGTVYEIFLKANLRGDMDQYFTPRELVNFMVKFADPKIGDVILDPACGSGGFLIQAFSHVNRKIHNAPLSEIETNKKFGELINKCLWGHEADYDLHVLAKINLIMHGDGWNNIHQGDSLISNKLNENFYDIILMNPPFTIAYPYPSVLNNFELGKDKKSEELDILFVERSINLLKEDGELYVVLPEGLLNNKKYQYFRDWLLAKTDLLLVVSLPEGAFVPFGSSASKTCILGVRKKNYNEKSVPPEFVFLANANEVGFKLNKKNYIPKVENDLSEFEYLMNSVFEDLKKTSNNSECAWIRQSELTSKRLDANYLLNTIDRQILQHKFETVIPLGSVCTVENYSIIVEEDEYYNYLEVPDISEQTGTVTNIRKLKGTELKQSYNRFYTDDILYTRINPKISRVAIAPEINNIGIVSKEVFRIKLIENEYISHDDRFALCAILQSELVQNQLVRLPTGSSSSRARVQQDDFLDEVYIPVPDKSVLKEISASTYTANQKLWKESQSFLDIFSKNQLLLHSHVDRDDFRKI